MKLLNSSGSWEEYSILQTWWNKKFSYRKPSQILKADLMFAEWSMRTLGLALQATRAEGAKVRSGTAREVRPPQGDQPACSRQFGQIGGQEWGCVWPQTYSVSLEPYKQHGKSLHDWLAYQRCYIQQRKRAGVTLSQSSRATTEWSFLVLLAYPGHTPNWTQFNPLAES